LLRSKQRKGNLKKQRTSTDFSLSVVRMINKLPKKINGGISQAGQRENHRFFSVFKSVNLVEKSDDAKT